jgi:integrase/recombinase XerD
MEIVSELLGHLNMNITQFYNGKVVQKKVSEEIKRLSVKKIFDFVTIALIGS